MRGMSWLGPMVRRLAHAPVGWRPTEMVVCEEFCLHYLPTPVAAGLLGSGPAQSAFDPRSGPVGAGPWS